MLSPTLADYELFIYALQDEHPSIQTSTLTVIRQANDVATVEGAGLHRSSPQAHSSRHQAPPRPCAAAFFCAPQPCSVD